MPLHVSDTLNSTYDDILSRAHDAVISDAGLLLDMDQFEHTWAQILTGWTSSLALHACVLGCASALREINIDPDQLTTHDPNNNAHQPDAQTAHDWLTTALTSPGPDLLDHIDQELMTRGRPNDHLQVATLMSAILTQARVAHRHAHSRQTATTDQVDSHSRLP